ncbi:hypothetical protein I4U23_010306 [Adineta vaga]|nr:hypothetical protein I4U23_010306 [Adineta vaga]
MSKLKIFNVLWRRTLPENHLTIAVTHFNIPTTYTGLGRFEEAIASTERSIIKNTLPSNHLEVVDYKN